MWGLSGFSVDRSQGATLVPQHEIPLPMGIYPAALQLDPYGAPCGGVHRPGHAPPIYAARGGWGWRSELCCESSPIDKLGFGRFRACPLPMYLAGQAAKRNKGAISAARTTTTD